MIELVVFAGIANLPLVAAEHLGLFAKRGLTVRLTPTPNSKEQRAGMADGRYPIVQTAVDNAFALKDTAGVDVAIVHGGDNSFNRLLVQPHIATLADIRGKTVVVDAVDTAFALQLYEILRANGVGRDEYDVRPVGSSQARLAEMAKDPSAAAAMLSPPYSILGARSGLKDTGGAAAALGAYQGSGIVVLRSWATANRDMLTAFLAATIEGTRWALDPANDRQVIALLAQYLSLPDDIAALTYATTVADFATDGAISMPGIDRVLALRAQYTGRPAQSSDRYLDLSFHQNALASL